MGVPPKANVVVGLLGPKLDAGLGKRRLNRWRPTVSLVGHDAFPVARIELLYQGNYTDLAKRVALDIAEESPGTIINLVEIPPHDPWDLPSVYTLLHDFATGYTFDTDRENYFVHITTGTHVAQICLFLLTEARYFPASLIQTSPGSEGVRSVKGTYSVIDLDLSRYDKIAARFKQERRRGTELLKGGIATRNESFNTLIRRIERVAAASPAPILLTGPTGAGKSALARRLYELRRSRRQVAGALVEVNCATIRGDGAMSALFGHRRGAFTGAMESRQGLLVAANRGLLFLDEIGELGPDEQAMLLRAIEEKRFLPVGADKEVESDFQLVAGTNRDLSAEVGCGRFREDLLARINLWTFRLPGLAERREDIEPNLDYELEAHSTRTGSHVRMSREARAAFLKFAESNEAPWTANFRDLSAAVTRMATLSSGGRVTLDDVNEEITRLRALWRGTSHQPSGSLVEEVLSEEKLMELDLFDRVQLEGVLAVCRVSKSISEAGRTLFQASRAQKAAPNDADRLRKYLARHGLSWSDL